MFLARLVAMSSVRLAAVRHRLAAVRRGYRTLGDARGGNHGDARWKVELRWRGRDAPLERVTAPWVLTRLGSAAGAAQEGSERDQLRRTERDRSDDGDASDRAR